MAYTNKTTNYELPQYVPTDQPTYLEDFNGAMFTIDSGMAENSTNIGDLSSLTTTAKSNLVSAVNEVNANSGASLIGDLSNLTTTEKSTVVGAINEINGNTNTNTSSIGTLSSLTTTVKTDLVSAINEVDGNTDTNTTSIGDLTSLTTTAKDSLVNAINEVASSSGSGGVRILDVTNNSSSNPIIFDNLDIGEYIFYTNNVSTYLTQQNVYFKNKTTDTSSDSCNIVSGAILKVIKKMSDMTSRYDYMGEISYIYCESFEKYKLYICNIGKTNGGNIELNKSGNKYLVATSAPSANKMVRTDSSSGIYWADFNTIGSNYNSSAIQYLKNVNGTLNWVTESNVTPSMIYMGKINAYNSASNALDLSSYPAGTRIVLKHNDSSRGFFLKVGSNTAEVTVTTSNDEAILNNTYYVDVNSISGDTASVSVVWASTYEWCPIVTNTIMVTFASGGATVGTITRNMQGYTLFQLEEDSSGNLNTNVLQYFITIRTKTFSKQYAPQRPAIHYLDKDKNSCLMSFTSITSGSQQVYEGIMTTKTASASGLYETYKIRLELNYSNGVYQSHVLNKTKLGDVFDATAITGYSATGTKTLGLNDGALEWV